MADSSHKVKSVAHPIVICILTNKMNLSLGERNEADANMNRLAEIMKPYFKIDFVWSLASTINTIGPNQSKIWILKQNHLRTTELE